MLKKKITALLQEQSKNPTTLQHKDIDDYMNEFLSLQERIATGLKQIDIKNDNDLENIYNTIDGKEKREHKSSLTKENNNSDKTSNIINKKQRTNEIKEEKQEVKTEKQNKSVEIDANNTNNKDKNEINIKTDHPRDTNNMFFTEKNTQIKTSNNNIDKSKFRIKPEIEITNPVGDKINDDKQSEINNKNSNEIKPQDKNNNNGLIIEDQNENEKNPINNNQCSKLNLCPGCNCKCWPFN